MIVKVLPCHRDTNESRFAALAFDGHVPCLPDRQKNSKSFIPNHGDVYSTALLLSGIDPAGKGRNDRPPLKFIARKS